MKKGLLWLMGIGLMIGVVLVGWELVAKPGPLRKVWWAYKLKRNPIYEARIQFTLSNPISAEQLAAENQLLDSRDLLIPLVRELGLVEAWQVPDETAAMVRLAQASNIRRGSSDLEIQLFVQGPDQAMIGKVINPLAQRYVKVKEARAGLQPGGDIGP